MASFILVDRHPALQFFQHIGTTRMAITPRFDTAHLRPVSEAFCVLGPKCLPE
jgi:hypothetical protein